MRNKKWIGVSLIVLCGLVVGFGIFTLWPNGGFLDKAFGQAQKVSVYLIGPPWEFPEQALNGVPPGYRWVTEEEFFKVGPRVKTWDPDWIMPAPLISFALNEDGSNVGEFIKFARENGYDEIYLSYPRPLAPDTVLQPALPELSEVLDALRGFSISDILVPKAFADSIKSPSCQEPGDTFWPSGSQFTGNPIDDNSGDGMTPSITFRFEDYGSWSCHVNSMINHLFLNMGSGLTTHPPGDFVKCMEAHNGATSIDNPIGTVVHIWNTLGAMQSACGCGSCVACGSRNPNHMNHKRSVDQIIHLAQGHYRSSPKDIRAEIPHNYGYKHPDDYGTNCNSSANTNNVSHCCDSHGNYDPF